jgi:preprotein translocase subunit YajC
VSSEQLGSLLPLVLILAAAYLLLIRPARKRAQDVNALQRSLTVGVDVMLTSGIFGHVTHIDGDRVQVEVAPGVVVTVHRGAIGKVVGEVASDPDDGDGAPSEAGSVSDDPAVDTDPGPESDTRGAH